MVSVPGASGTRTFSGEKQAVLRRNRSCCSDRSLQLGKLLAGKIEISKEEGLKCV